MSERSRDVKDLNAPFTLPVVTSNSSGDGESGALTFFLERDLPLLPFPLPPPARLLSFSLRFSTSTSLAFTSLFSSSTAASYGATTSLILTVDIRPEPDLPPPPPFLLLNLSLSTPSLLISATTAASAALIFSGSHGQCAPCNLRYAFFIAETASNTCAIVVSISATTSLAPGSRASLYFTPLLPLLLLLPQPLPLPLPPPLLATCSISSLPSSSSSRSSVSYSYTSSGSSLPASSPEFSWRSAPARG
ncbi:hypothetical protein PanWU01x14_078960 [Parasponia andersonii]|uniref:Uncharacterized protein n=1 Tax=Parasponia andersonii TaxID=3476 RepID=A0A2P5DC97_PARAD|nr:hypothetical protein PanWU01x14_078960 [Parasponia andersonii]